MTPLITLRSFRGESKATLPLVKAQEFGEGSIPALSQWTGPQEPLSLSSPLLRWLGCAGLTWRSPTANLPPPSSHLVSHRGTGLVSPRRPRPFLGDPSLDPALPQPGTGDQDPIPVFQSRPLPLGVSRMKPGGCRARAARRPPPASPCCWQRPPHRAGWSTAWWHFSWT